MRIIGSTENGYLVEANGEELACAAGFRWPHEVPGVKQRDGRYHREWYFPIGFIINPTEATKYMQSLRENEAKCRSSAALLRGMADMIDAALPTTAIAPALEKEASA